MSRKLCFKVDMDCVLFDLPKSIISHYNETFDDNVTDYYASYRFSQCTKTDRKFFVDLLDQKGLFLNLLPMVDEMLLIRELYHQGHKIIFVTKPHPSNKYCKVEKLLSLEKYFSDIEYDLVFTKDKYLILGDIFIDDDLTYITNPDEKAFTICYGDYGWNKDYKGVKATNVEELRDIVNKRLSVLQLENYSKVKF